MTVYSSEVSSGNSSVNENEFQTISDGNAQDEVPLINEDSLDDLQNEDLDDPYMAEVKQALAEILSERSIMALVYLSDEYPIRNNPTYEGDVVATVPSGQLVQILDVAVDYEYGEVWEYVSFYQNDALLYGYIPRNNLACSDEKFLAWEDTYGMNPASMMYTTFTLGAPEEQSTISPDIEQFPESYKEALYALKALHPNWTFVKMNTGLDWNTVVQNEMVTTRSLVPSSYPEYYKNGSYSSGWAYASEDALKFYLDPRNGIKESTIFQFEQLTYNESYQSQEALQTFLNGTFMKGLPLADDKHNPYTMTYAQIIYFAGKEQNVSPFHLACRLKQEQGAGTSKLISGDYSGYEGYFNYFNIGASGSTPQAVIVSGLQKAKEQGWNSRYDSIYGGARFVASSYISKGQDTVYLQKFDVDSSYNGLYWHQYMQNICAPTSEGKNIKKVYTDSGSLDNTFVFKIPVYNNMPSQPCQEPAVRTDVTVTPPAGYTDNHIYLDGVAYEATLSDGAYTVTAPNNTAKTAVMYKYNESNVPIGMYVWTLSYNGYKYIPTAETGLTDLLTYHGFSIRITGVSGIRFKTGIAKTVRNQLLTTGINGYNATEYGTILMNHANMTTYPLVLNGTKTKKVVSYGTDTNGTHVDRVFETVNDRYRYTAVLINLPASQYKTEFAFRGYCVLTKGGNDIIVYGPPVWRSIYYLSQYTLDSGKHEVGSDADLFLRQIISDADALDTPVTN